MAKDITFSRSRGLKGYISMNTDKKQLEPYTGCDKYDCTNKNSELCNKCRGRIYGKGGYQWGE